MSQQTSAPHPEAQTTIDDDSWTDNSETNPSEQLSNRQSEGVAISQSPQPVVNSTGVVIPLPRDSLQPIEEWGCETPTVPDFTELFDTEPRLKPISSYAKTSDTEPSANHSTGTRHSPDIMATEEGPVQESCPECGGEVTVANSDHYCDDCGLLICDQSIDPGPEWRAFDSQQQENRSRVGSPINNTIHDKGLSTEIGNDSRDAMGQPISAKVQKKMSRLRKWDNRFKVKSTKERNLRQAFGEIQRVSSEMDLPDFVEETACTVYRKALDKGLLPGRSIEAMSTASVYIAVRQAQIPKTLDELLDYSRVSEERVTGAYSYLGKELGLEIEPPKVSSYLSGIASELGVSNETEQQARELLDMSVSMNLHSGKSPAGLAAAAIYASTMITRCDRVTQEAASTAGDVCELTIRTRNRELLEAHGLDHDEVSPPSKSEVEEKRAELGIAE